MAARDRRQHRPAFVTPAQVDLRRPHPLDPAASDPPMRLVGEPAEETPAEETPAGVERPNETGQPVNGGAEAPTTPPGGEGDDVATVHAEPQEPATAAPDVVADVPAARALSVVAPAADIEPLTATAEPEATAAPAKARPRKRAASAPQPEPEPEPEVVEPLVALGTRIPRSMMKRLKVAAVQQDKTVQDAVTEAVKKWLDEGEA